MSDKFVLNNWWDDAPKEKKVKSMLLYQLEFYEVLREFLGCYASEHIGEATLDLEAISTFMESDKFLFVYKLEHTDKEALFKLFEEQVLEGYPVWEFFNISDWSKRMCEINFKKDINEKKDEEAKIYKCPTCRFLEIRHTSIGSRLKCKGRKFESRMEEIEFIMANGRELDHLDEYQKECKLYKGMI